MLRMNLKLLIGLMMSSSMALAAAGPEFIPPVTVGRGDLSQSKNQPLAFDNTSKYATFHNDGAQIVVSSDNGAKWSISKTFTGADNFLSERIAVSKDPLYPGKSIVHAVWRGTDTGGNAVFYAFKANRPSQTGWSTPVRAINLSPDSADFGHGVSLVVSNSGTVHIMNGRQYVSAASPGTTFSSPVDICPDLGNHVPVLSIDAANNLYAVFRTYDPSKLVLIKKAADTTVWSGPVTIYDALESFNSLSGNFDVVVLDANNIYLSAYEGADNGENGNLFVLISTNGGTTWTKRIVVEGTTRGKDGENNPSLTVSPSKIITYASEIYDTDGKNPVIKVWRSKDNGVTWSVVTTVKGTSNPHLTLDPSGKVNILFSDVKGNLLWSKEK